MYKRKKYLIYKEFQLRMILFNFFITTLFLSVYVYLILNGFDSISSVLSKAGIPSQHPIYNFISFQKSELFSSVAIFSVIVTVTMTLLNLFLSHRISGPIVRLINYLRDVKEGKEHEKLEFRENDFFQDLSVEINEVLETKSVITSAHDGDKKASA